MTQREQIAADRALDLDAGNDDGGQRHNARCAVMRNPWHPDERPFEKELRGQRGNREIEALDAERRQAEQDAHSGSHQARQREDHKDVEPGNPDRNVVGGIGTHTHEAAGAERNLTGITGEQVQADRRECVDQEWRQDRPQPIVVAGKRDRHEGDQQNDDEPDAILQDREYRLIRGVAGLELADLAIQHFSDPLDDLLAEQALRPDQQEQHRQHVGEPGFDAAAQHRPEEHFRQFLAGADDQARRRWHRGWR